MTSQSDVLWMPGGVRTEVRLTAQDTDGAFALLVDEPPVGWALPTHRHAYEAEVIQVLRGEFEITIEDQVRVLGPGESIHIACGQAHSSRNLGTDTGRRMLMFAPAGMEAMFREIGTASPGEEVDPQAVLAAAKRYGWRFFPPHAP